MRLTKLDVMLAGGIIATLVSAGAAAAKFQQYGAVVISLLTFVATTLTFIGNRMFIEFDRRRINRAEAMDISRTIKKAQSFIDLIMRDKPIEKGRNVDMKVIITYTSTIKSITEQINADISGSCRKIPETIDNMEKLSEKLQELRERLTSYSAALDSWQNEYKLRAEEEELKNDLVTKEANVIEQRNLVSCCLARIRKRCKKYGA